MKTIFQKMRAGAPKSLLVSILFIILMYIYMSLDAYHKLSGWMHTIIYVMIFIAVYFALFSFVVIIVDRLKKLKGDRPQ